MSRTVSVLFAARNSVYKSLPCVDVYDRDRDALTFPGDTPIVAHPPCRAWSAYFRHQAKPEPGESDLGIWAAEQLRQCGGVLEQPAHSRLWSAAQLPLPGDGGDGLFSIAVWQKWWGYPTKKATWLCFCGVDRDVIHIPYSLHASGMDRRTMKLMSHSQRSHTVRPFAEWLVNLARLSRTLQEIET